MLALGLVAALLAAVPARAWNPPAVPPVKLAPGFGKAPAETAVPMLWNFERYRKTDTLARLGDKNYHVSFQPMRDGSWVVALLEEGLGHRELSASFPRAALLTGKLEAELGGVKYAARYDPMALPPAVEFAPVGGGAGVRLALSELQGQTWEKAVPVPALGPEWRVMLSVDLWVGAGMTSFVFVERTLAGYSFYPVRAESVESSEERVKEVGGRKVGLRIDPEPEGGRLLIRPLE